MAKLVVPATVQTVMICADHDANGVGYQAAEELAQRLLAEGRRVKVFLPERVGTDWLDVYRDPHSLQMHHFSSQISNFSKTLANDEERDAQDLTRPNAKISNFSNFSREERSLSPYALQGAGNSHIVRVAATVARYKRHLYADPYFGAPAHRAQGIPVAILITKETPDE